MVQRQTSFVCSVARTKEREQQTNTISHKFAVTGLNPSINTFEGPDPGLQTRIYELKSQLHTAKK